jgi:transcriptional regulator
MYIPEHFRETRIEVLQPFIERHPLATLVAQTDAGLTANLMPLQAQLRAETGGRLQGHIARANSLWRDLRDGASVLAIFTGAEHYISPSWYPSKKEHGKAVPTWNYATVHVHGSIRFIDDKTWLRNFVASLTDQFEHGRVNRWHIEDAPADYLEGMLRAIVGFEIDISRIEGKFKGSQNRSTSDRAGARDALSAEAVAPADIVELAPESERK